MQHGLIAHNVGGYRDVELPMVQSLTSIRDFEEQKIGGWFTWFVKKGMRF